MKILFIGSVPPPTGGDAIWALNYLSYLNNSYNSVSIVNTSLIGRRAFDLVDKYSFFDEIIRCTKIWILIIVRIVKFRPDIVHINSNCSPLGIIRDFISLSLAKFSGAPIFLHFHSNVVNSLGVSSISKFFFRYSLLMPAKVIVLNIDSFNFCKSNFNIVPVIIPNFISEDQIFIHKIIRNDISKILFVGHLIRSKGIFEIFEVAKKNTNINFIMAGAITSDLLNVKIPSNVTLLGDINKKEIFELLKSVDIFLFPTYTEGFSMALLEAMGAGLPIITTPVGANHESLEGKGGFLVPIYSVDEICKAINIMRSSKLRREMSDWNICKVKNSYTSSIVMQKLINLYNLELTSKSFL